MNVHKRFIVQFFLQLIFMFTLVLIVFITFSVVIGFSTMNLEAKNDLSKADSLFFDGKIDVKNNKVVFSSELKKMAKKQNSWLVVLTLNRDVIGTYNAPMQLPNHLSKSVLASLMLQDEHSDVTYTYWEIHEYTEKPLLLFLGQENSGAILLPIVKSEVDWNHHQLNLSHSTIQQMNENNSWVQLINADGEVKDESGTEKQPKKYSIKQLQKLSNKEDKTFFSYYDKQTDQTILLGINPSNSYSNFEEDLFKTVKSTTFIIFVLGLILLISGTIWYASKFGIPLLTMMNWIKNLGDGNYQEPLDQHQRPVMLKKNGKLKRKYRLYKDLIVTLSQLTETLQKNKQQSLKITQTREEWISGLSHDLKTPLATISGYAEMLKSKQYSWREEEVKAFSSTIAEKSTYMKELLEDLTITYQLKNEALPIAKEKVDMNEFIRRIVIHYINDPTSDDKEFIFHPYHQTVEASIDPKWFQRIIDNLIANAMKYNPAQTTITVSVTLIEQHLVVITIKDNGKGMDNETLAKLFNRYYRGTDTTSSDNGTGLGMAITKKLVELHGGSINVKSQLNEGTTVRIILPVLEEEN
ncbi:sensor histidine kinase [Niallia sp. 01092]|uniref:sensor histidine kinase n=1 Tax=unclassified Niallia TaxID=2837522 RepID=UPI003FD2DECB